MAADTSTAPASPQPSSKKVTSSSKPSSKAAPRVRFSTPHDAKSIEREILRRRREEENPAKVFMGESHIARDVSFFVAMLAFAAFLASGYDTTKTKVKKETPEQAMLKLLQRKAKETSDRRRKEPCDLYVDTGTIPKTGLTYFSGQAYETGDTVMESTMQFPLGDGLVPHYALVLKHHPDLANVVGPLYQTLQEASDQEQNRVVLRALRPIAPSEELFLAYDPTLHNNPFFRRIPSADDYTLAGVIVEDARRTLNRPSKTHRKTVGSAAMYRLLQRTVERFHPTVANLLPENSKLELGFPLDTPSLSLKNSSVYKLETSAVCVDDMVPSLSLGDGAQTVRRKDVRQGELVGRIPLYVVRNNDDYGSCHGGGANACRALPPNCMRHGSVAFCPLSATVARVGDDPNVEYRWKDTEMMEYTTESLVAMEMLYLDVVALRTLVQGDEIRAGGDAADSSGSFKIPPNLLPEHWT